jgi:hypothetical protein
MNRVYLDQPREVSIETLALCNAACEFCPYETLERRGVRMGDELIDRLIMEMSAFKHPFFVSPFKVNEPLLDSRFLDITRTIVTRAPQAYVRVFTNGTTLTKSATRALAQIPRIYHLWCSLNSCDEEEHQTLMRFRNPMLPLIARNLDDLHSMKQLRAFSHPVVLSRVRTYDDRDADFVNACEERWPLFQACLIKRDSWLGEIPAPQVTVPDAPCSRWFELSIMATGKVALCCMDSTGEFAIGDVTGETMLEVYNRPHWRERRERSLSRLAVHPCATCTY